MESALLKDSDFVLDKRVRTKKTEEQILEDRYLKAIESLKSPIKVGCYTVTVREVSDLATREKPLSNKVADALCTLTRRVLKNDSRELRVEVLDSKFIAQLNKLHTKFSKSTEAEPFMFPKGMVDGVLCGEDPE